MRTSSRHAGHSADQRDGIDPEMPAKMPIFMQEQGVDELGTDLGQGRSQAVLLFARQRQTQQLAILSVDRSRQGRMARQRRMREDAEQDQHEHRTRRQRIGISNARPVQGCPQHTACA